MTFQDRQHGGEVVGESVVEGQGDSRPIARGSVEELLEGHDLSDSSEQGELQVEIPTQQRNGY